MKKTLITGGAGFLASHLCEKLLDLGHEVCVENFYTDTKRNIIHLPTYEKEIFLYLYLLLDEYSRKALSWLVSWHQTAQEAQRLLA